MGAPVDNDQSASTIKVQLEAVRAASDIDPKIQAKAIEYFEQALKSLEQAAASKAAAEQYAADDRAAPKRLQEARQAIATPPATAPTVDGVASTLTLAEIEQKSAAEQTDLAATRSKLQEIQDQLAREQTRPDELQRAMADARQRLAQIEEELKGPAPEGEPPVLTEARRAALLARQQMRRAEIAAGEAELAGRDTRVQLLTARRDLGLRDVSQAEDRVAAWQQLTQKRLGTEAKIAAEEAARAEAQVANMPEVVRDLARENSDIADKFGAIRKREQELVAQVAAAAGRLETLKEDFAGVRQRVEVAGLNEAIGLVLRQQRATLPNLRSYRRSARARARETSDLAEQQLENDVRRRDLTDLQERVSETVAQFDASLSEPVRAQATTRVEELLTQQQSLVGDLGQDYGRYMRQLGALDNAERELAARAGEYRDFINEHLLWIRSTKALGSSTPGQTKSAVIWLADPARWQRVGSDLGASWARPWPWLGIMVIVGLVILLRRWARRDLKTVATLVGKIRTDSIGLTLRAVVASAILSAGWPLVLILLGWRVWSIHDSAPLTQAIGMGLIGAASLWALVASLRIVLRDGGLADKHYGWKGPIRVALRRPLLWLGPLIIVPLGVAVAAAEELGRDDFTGSLARFCFIGLMVLLLTSLVLVLRPRGAMLSAIVKRNPNSWLARARFVWAGLILVVPIGLIVLAVAGYYYTALQLGWRVEAMLWLGLGVLVVHQTLMRGVQVAQCRLAWEEAKRKRLEQQAAKTGGDEAPVSSARELDAVVVREDEVALDEISDETRGFIRTLTGAAAVLLLWALWADALPALGFLDQVQFWHYTGLVDGVEKQLPVTLASVGLAAVIGLVTILAARNLPGALEISVLKRLPLDTGARYAITTICRYVIVGVGLILAFKTLGVTGRSLQWLVAALSVGLGFGLQEIVANFVSGIIILFERPFRIGDIVQVGDVSGKVSRIRIRATTIVDWDRRELVVPNKSFITGQLINMTLSDPTARARIPIGIAYGSDVALARQILLKVAAEHELVVADPAPSALFLGFGDSALNMELRIFMADIGDKMKVTDQINERIDTEFKKAGIEIVFPQRDVNLKTPRPVEVVVVERGQERAGVDPPVLTGEAGH